MTLSSVMSIVASRPMRDLRGRAVQVAGREVPLLALAAVHRQLHDVAVGATERLVAVEQRLRRVGARGHVAQAAQRVAERGGVDDGGRAGRQAVDVDAEHQLRVGAIGDLEARLGLRVGREHHEQPSVEALGLERGRERHAHAGAGRLRGVWRHAHGEAGDGERGAQAAGRDEGLGRRIRSRLHLECRV